MRRTTVVQEEGWQAGRVVIDQAYGMAMALAPCRRGPARRVLVNMPRDCEAELPEVAAAVVAAWEEEPLSWRLRCAPRRLHAEDRACASPPAEELSGRGRS